MFRDMRRSRQLLSEEETRAILERRTAAVLAVHGDDGYPYAVPVSYVLDGNKIYFHGAKKGHKIESIDKNPKVSLCVIDEDQVVPEEYTTYFRSAIVFGKARRLETEEEIKNAARILAMKYSADYEEGIDKEINSQIKALCVVEIEIEHMTGKEAIEFVREKSK